MENGCERPLGDPTTILDLCDRDEQDDFMFPLDTEKSWFVRDASRRVLPFTPVIQEFPYRGPGSFGQRFQFELGSVKSCDLLFGLVVQIQLGSWFPQ